MDEGTIARLVLGYLREEGCRAAYKDFLKSSRCLQNPKFLSNKYVPTRFVGLTLNDILKEYYEIYQTVQGRLEATNYYREPHSNTSLSHQLIYLLNDKSNSSANSTPFRSPVHSHFDETSPIYPDHVSDVETTPAHKLPGNIRCDSEESNITNTPRKKNKSHKSGEPHIFDLTGHSGSPEVFLDTEILAQTLLENKEFQDKIAQTINKVAENKQRVSTEMDDTIQTVLEKTSKDPIFEKILEEIIASTNMDNVRIPEACSSKSADNSKKSLRKIESKEYSSDQHEETTNKRVEEQNAEAVQLIVDRSKTTDNPQLINSEKIKTLETQTQTQVMENGKNDIIVFDGSLDNYIISNTCSIGPQVPPPQAPFVLNTTGGLFMVPSTIQTSIAASTPANQLYFLNKPPLLNCYIPSPTVITEKDILAMPTVILNDDRPVPKPARKSRGPPRIQPKPQIEISTTADLSEFLTLNNHQEPNSGGKNVSNTPANSNSSSKQMKCDSNLPVIDSERPLELERETIENKDPVDNNTDGDHKIAKTSQATPPQTTNVKKNTPKSGSHVRNLDFLSPPKTIASRRSNARKNSDSKTKDTKKQTAKTLFRKNEKALNHSNEKQEEGEPWDAKLRSFVPENVKSATRASRKKKSKVKKKCNENEDVLNTTDQDGALLEAALKTPIKSDGKEAKNADAFGRSPFTNKEIKVLVHEDLEKKKHLKEGISEGLGKTVLSPSRLNASKRNLVHNTQTIVNGSTSQPADCTSIETNCKFVTPELIHDSLTHPIRANRNITPMLETPVKDDILNAAGLQTPCEFSLSSLTNYTPVTKMLEANLPGFDINLPTPNIPITPSFPPFTPTVDLMSPYSNRPTDYSTSSSYYQPSDSEQNRSLEAHLRELEKKPVFDGTKSDPGTNQHLQVFNKNVIGKKNLNLLQITKACCSSDPSSTSSDPSSDEDDDKSEKESNETVICKKKVLETPRKTYSLRNRNHSVKTPKVLPDKEVVPETDTCPGKSTKNVHNKSTGRIPKKIYDKKTIHVDESMKDSGTDKSHSGNVNNCSSTGKSLKTSSRSVLGCVSHSSESVLKELEEKRQRTINKFKTGDTTAINKQKKNGGGFIKIKPIPNISNQRRKCRKSDSPKKNTNKVDNNVMLSTLMKDLADSDTEDDISLRLSVSDEEEKMNLKKIEKLDKSTSDVEAQILIEGLKQRGIHLMHNKNTKSSTSTLAQDVTDAASKHDEKDASVELGHEKGPIMDYSLKEEFDTCLLTTEINFTFEECSSSTRNAETWSPCELKTLRARLYIDEIDDNVDIEFKLTDFHFLLDIDPSNVDVEQITNVKTSEESSKMASSSQNCELNSVEDKEQDKEEPSNESQSPTSSRKRKYQDDEESSHKEKKCKTYLQQISVESFLNNIHGSK